MKIGQAARQSGVSIRMLRYYEAQGLLEPPRSETRYREYSAEDVATARRIQILSRAGLTLAVIASILPCVAAQGERVASGNKPCAKFLAALRSKKDELEEQIALFERQRDALADYLAAQPEAESDLSISSAAGSR